MTAAPGTTSPGSAPSGGGPAGGGRAGGGRPGGGPPEGSPPDGGAGEAPVPQRGPGPPPGARHGPAAFMSGMSTEKPLNFRGSAGRLLGMLRPERPLIILATGLATVSVTLAVLGPLLLGHATNLIFAGVVGRLIPAGVTKAEMITRLRQEGRGTQADMLGSMNIAPGHGIDFSAVGRVLLIVLALYACAAVFSWLQGRAVATIVQRSVFRLREQAATKLPGCR